MKYIILIITFLMIGCTNIRNNTPSSPRESIKTYYENGTVESKIMYVDNKKNGKMTSYFENGKIAVKGFFKDDKRDKKWIFYNENNGKISSIERYIDGQLNGDKYIIMKTEK